MLGRVWFEGESDVGHAHTGGADETIPDHRGAGRPADGRAEKRPSRRSGGTGGSQVRDRPARADGRTYRALSGRPAGAGADRLDLSARGRRSGSLAPPERRPHGRRARPGARAEGLGPERRGHDQVPRRAQTHVRQPRLDEGHGRRVPRPEGRRDGHRPDHAQARPGRRHAPDDQAADGRQGSGEQQGDHRHPAGRAAGGVCADLSAGDRVRPRIRAARAVLSQHVRLHAGADGDREPALLRRRRGRRRAHRGRLRLGQQRRPREQQLLRRRRWRRRRRQ